MTGRLLAVGLRVTRRDPGHTHFDMFAAAPPPGLDVPVEDITRGRCGDGLCLRTYEFDAFVAVLVAGGAHVVLSTLRRARGGEIDPPLPDVDAMTDARALVAELVDPGDCSYDHHGYCQEHGLQERPCPHERAKRAGLADT